MKILIAGGGNMGLTYAQSFTNNHTVAAQNLYILERLPEKIAAFKELGFVSTYVEPGDFIRKMNLIILAVKPQDFPALAEKISPFLAPEQLVLSIMAGVTTQSIAQTLGVSRIVRAMPNLPAQIGMGMTAFTSTDPVSKSELFEVQNLLSTTGKALYFDDEAMLDAVTAVSGSGPAYVYFFMEAMQQAAISMGFTETQAEVLVDQTFLGAIHLKKVNNLSNSEWMDRVASKGGTTEAALRQFQQLEVAPDIHKALQAALVRAQELGR